MTPIGYFWLLLKAQPAINWNYFWETINHLTCPSLMLSTVRGLWMWDAFDATLRSTLSVLLPPSFISEKRKKGIRLSQLTHWNGAHIVVGSLPQTQTIENSMNVSQVILTFMYVCKTFHNLVEIVIRLRMVHLLAQSLVSFRFHWPVQVITQDNLYIFFAEFLIAISHFWVTLHCCSVL